MFEQTTATLFSIASKTTKPKPLILIKIRINLSFQKIYQYLKSDHIFLHYLQDRIF